VTISTLKNGVLKDAGSTIQSLPGVIKFRWDLVHSESGEVISAGLGFLAINDEGRICCDYLFTEL